MMTRRQFALTAAVAPAASLTGFAASVTEVPRSQQQIARRLHALAEEMSHLLADLDGGSWQMRVAPPFDGEAMVHAEPMHVSPELQLHRASAMTIAALNRLHQCAWRVERDPGGDVMSFIKSQRRQPTAEVVSAKKS